MPTHYEVLGVPPDAAAGEVRAAYLRAARLYHPDRHARSPAHLRDEAEQAMRELNAAWTVLGDPLQRRRYDRAIARPSRGTRRTVRNERARTLALDTGFESWLGGLGTYLDADGRKRFNLRVAGATTLAPLAALAPDRLVGLHAAGSTVGDADLVHLRDMTGLRTLDLTGTRVTDTGLLHLQGCTGLESLWLWDTDITDGGVDLVARLPHLRQLGLGNTRVSDAGLAPMSQLHRLRLLQLWGTDVIGPGLAHLHGLPELEFVTLPWRVRRQFRRRLRASLAPAAIVA